MNFNIDKLPVRISPCPIAEAIVELRFESLNMPVEVFLGSIYEHFKNKNPKLEKLPILDLPAVLRDTDPGLLFSPYYRFTVGEFQLQFGPRSFAVVNPKEYAGWTNYSTLIRDSFDFLEREGILQNPSRLGLRYISFFEGKDILSSLKVGLDLSGNSMIPASNIIRSEFNYQNFRCIVQLGNNTLLNNEISGSTIDLDIIKEEKMSLKELASIIDSAHELEKQIFFSLLKEDFLNEFNPEY